MPVPPLVQAFFLLTTRLRLGTMGQNQLTGGYFPMNIGLLGFGVVGGGVLELTQSRSDIAVSRVLLRSPKAGLPEGLATYDFNDILTDSAIDTVVEVMGGLHPAYEYVSAAMERGKNVVTANKALIAAYYPELTALAREKGVALRCTAAVGGGIPWLVNLARVKRLDTVSAVGGIMNGTTNFIMDAMRKRTPPPISTVMTSAGSCVSPPTSPLTQYWRRRPFPPSASAPSRRRTLPPSRPTASCASCWPQRSPRKTASVPMWSPRW